MILCFTSDDSNILNDAYSSYDKKVFGIPYCYLKNHNYRGLLEQNENLFISAHGNDHEIGNEQGNPSYTPKQLANVLVNYVLPGKYTGSIYVSACGSAPMYVNSLLDALGANFAERIYGMYGDIDYDIKPPSNQSWLSAAFSIKNISKDITMPNMTLTNLDEIKHADPHALLKAIFTTDNTSTFQDSDGLISFVNMSSSFVTDNKEYQTGRAVCDKISNFFATLRIKVFGAFKKGTIKLLPGDAMPDTQWDPAVTHCMQYLLSQAGGLTNFKIVTETYSVTQLITEFSTDIIKMMFDAATIPENIITDVIKFVQGVGQTLRVSWDDKSKHYATTLLGQCHEAVPVDNTGSSTVYFPKIKYYYISVDSSQQVFTSPCVKTERLTFNFRYEYYVTGLKASILDTTSDDYKNFVKFLDKAQGVSYKEADNNLDAILGVVSDKPATVLEMLADGTNVFGVDLKEYPSVAIEPPCMIERILNRNV